MPVLIAGRSGRVWDRVPVMLGQPHSDPSFLRICCSDAVILQLSGPITANRADFAVILQDFGPITALERLVS